jgi:hypothetical protein
MNGFYFSSSYVLAGSNCVEKERDSGGGWERERGGCRVLAEKWKERFNKGKQIGRIQSSVKDSLVVLVVWDWFL